MKQKPIYFKVLSASLFVLLSTTTFGEALQSDLPVKTNGFGGIRF